MIKNIKNKEIPSIIKNNNKINKISLIFHMSKYMYLGWKKDYIKKILIIIKVILIKIILMTIIKKIN